MSRDRNLHQVLAELELVSHVSAVHLDSSGGHDAADDIGGKRPPGGIDQRDEKRTTAEDIYTLKSVDYFRRLVERAHSDYALERILVEAEDCLRLWKRQTWAHEPDSRADPRWKQWAADSPLDDGTIANRFSCSRQYVNKIRRQYRDAA